MRLHVRGNRAGHRIAYWSFLACVTQVLGLDAHDPPMASPIRLLMRTTLALYEATVCAMGSITVIAASCTRFSALADDENHALLLGGQAHPTAAAGVMRADSIGRIRMRAWLPNAFAFTFLIIRLADSLEAHNLLVIVVGDAMTRGVARRGGRASPRGCRILVHAFASFCLTNANLENGGVLLLRETAKISAPAV